MSPHLRGLRSLWAAVPREHWPSGGEFDQMIDAHWDEVWGDRRQELVFIGIDMDEALIRGELDACLMDASSGFAPELWA